MGEAVAFEHVDGGLLVLGVFVGFGHHFLDLFGEFGGVNVVVSAGDVHDYLGVLFGVFLSFLEVLFGGFVVAVEEVDLAEANVVVATLGICGDAFVEGFLGFLFLALSQVRGAEVVAREGLVSAESVHVSLEQGYGIVILAGFVILDSVFVAIG